MGTKNFTAKKPLLLLMIKMFDIDISKIRVLKLHDTK